jgi:hypothetical protein
MRSLLIALLIGSLVGFADFVASVHGASKYDPPISAEESRQLRGMPIEKAEAVLATRRKILSRGEWVAGSLRYSYFWKGVAKDSVFPVIGIFVSCLLIGRWQLRDGSSQ